MEHPETNPTTQLPTFLNIGNTPILEVPELSDYFGFKHLAIKNEGANYFGTHKDRKSASVVLEASSASPHERPQALCILTAGNAGLSLARIAAYFGLPVTAFVGERVLPPTLDNLLAEKCEQVIRLDLEGKEWSSEELRKLAGERNGRRVLDSTNGVTTPFESIVDEIVQHDPTGVPDVIVLPIGSGELFIGVAEGLRKHKLRTRLVGVTVGKDSSADKLYSKWNPQGGQLATMVKPGSPHRSWQLTDEVSLLETLGRLKEVKAFSCEASSAAAFAALHQLRREVKSKERVLVVNTGTFDLTRILKTPLRPEELF